MNGLGKNRVMMRGQVEQLRGVGSATLGSGLEACTAWECDLEGVEGLSGGLGGAEKSAALEQALSSVSRPLRKVEHERLKLSLEHTLGKLTENLPACDRKAAEAQEIITAVTENAILMIRELADYIDLAGTDMDAFSYSSELLRLNNSWGEAERSMEESMAYAMTVLKGLPEYVNFYGDPVNMETGNFLCQYEDLAADAGGRLSFLRTYNALDKRKGSLGRGFTHNWESSLTITEEEIKLLSGDGREEVFAPDREVWRSRQNPGRVLYQRGNFYLHEHQGSTCFYDRTGRLSGVLGQDGAFSFLVYEPEQEEKTEKEEKTEGASYENTATGKSTLLKEVRLFTGEALFFSYNGKGQLTGVSDHTGRRATYSYEGKKLCRVSDPLGQTMCYTYGANGRMETITDKRGVLILKNSYDEYRRITGQSFPDGTEMTYSYPAGTNRTCLTDQNESRAVYVHDSSFRSIRVQRETGRVEYGYDERGNRIRETDRRGNVTRYGYDEAGRIIQVTDALSHTTQTAYDSAGRKERITYPDGSMVSCIYDEEGRATAVTDQLGRTTHYRYQGGTSQPVEILLADESSVELSYDKKGNLLHIINGDGTGFHYRYDERNRVTGTADGNGSQTAYQYDALDRLILVERADHARREYRYNEMGEAKSILDFDGFEMSWSYNVLNKPESYTDKEGRTTRIEYDRMWNPVKVTDPQGCVTSYVYDADNRLGEVVTKEGSTIHFSYDPDGNRTAVCYPDGTTLRYTYDAANRRTTEQDGTGRTISYAYDAMGRLACVTDGAGGKSFYRYDKAGNRIGITDAAGAETTFEYTALNRLCTIHHPQGGTEQFGYYPGGRLKYHDKGDGTCLHFTYDRAGNLIQTDDGQGTPVKYRYDCLNRVEEVWYGDHREKRYAYDAMGRVTGVTDEAGNTVAYTYSPMGNLLCVTDPLGNQTRYGYNGRDELTGILRLTREEAADLTGKTSGLLEAASWLDKDLMRAELLSGKQQQLHRTLFTRDGMGRITTVTNALGEEEHYAYDGMGRIRSKTNALLETTTCSYTPDGSLQEAHYADGRSVLLSYDALHTLQKVKDWLGETAFLHDAMGRVTRTTDCLGNTVSYEYTPEGKRERLYYPDGSQAFYRYDEQGRLLEITAGDFGQTCAYDSAGRLVSCHRKNGIDSFYTYDSHGRRNQTRYCQGDTLLEEIKSVYDGLGNMVEQERRSREASYSSHHFYTYDPNGRLTGVLDEAGLIREYHYDGYGNRSAMITCNGTEREETLYHYDLTDRLIGKTKDGTTIPTASHREEPDKRSVFCELPEKEGAGEENIRYTVDRTDPFNRRISEEGNICQNYLWQENRLWGIPDAALYVLTDHQGTPLRVTDAEGSTRNLYQYDEYGRLEQYQEEILFPFGYTGHIREEEPDLYQAGAREYDATSGSFCSKDPLSYFNSKDILTHNLYAYGKGNPLRYVDYGGHACIKEPGMDEMLLAALNHLTDLMSPVDFQDYWKDAVTDFNPGSLDWWVKMGENSTSMIPGMRFMRYTDADFLRGIGKYAGLLSHFAMDSIRDLPEILNTELECIGIALKGDARRAITGYDFPADIRDLIKDVTVDYQPDSKEWKQKFFIDVISIFPVVGIVKQEEVKDVGTKILRRVAPLFLSAGQDLFGEVTDIIYQYKPFNTKRKEHRKANEPFSLEHFKKAITNDLFIENQDMLGEDAGYQYADSNASKMGCGPVAVYNVLHQEGENISFNEVLYETDIGTVGGGANILCMAEYLEDKGYTTEYLIEDKIDKQAQNYDALIMTCSDVKCNGHYFTMIPTGTKNQNGENLYQFYNGYDGYKNQIGTYKEGVLNTTGAKDMNIHVAIAVKKEGK